MPDRGQTEHFTKFVEEFTFRQIPAQVLERTKDVTFDGLGALLSAVSPRYDLGGVVARIVEETGGAPDASVFGTAVRTNCATAALVNGTFAYYGDIESYHPGAIMHAIAVVGPAALAVGERMHRSGRDVLSAIVVGIDVACRVSSALNPITLFARGFHPTCVAGTFGAAAAAARLYGLRSAALRRAFGLAGTEASGLLAWVSDPTEHSRPFNMGLAARHGVFAAHLASCGFGGPPEIFEGKYPLGRAFTGEWHPGELFDGLGERFKVMELYFKQYACCAFIHPGLDGLLDLMGAAGVRPDAIRRMTLRFPASGHRVINGNALRSHCAQYVLALAAYKGAVGFYDILHDQRTDRRIDALSRRVNVVGDDDLDRTYPELYRSIIDVETADGAHHVRDVTHPKGSPQNPLTRGELADKFARLTEDVLPPGRAAEITEAIRTLEDLPDIGAFTALLRGGPVHPAGDA